MTTDPLRPQDEPVEPLPIGPAMTDQPVTRAEFDWLLALTGRTAQVVSLNPQTDEGDVRTIQALLESALMGGAHRPAAAPDGDERVNPQSGHSIYCSCGDCAPPVADLHQILKAIQGTPTGQFRDDVWQLVWCLNSGWREVNAGRAYVNKVSVLAEKRDAIEAACNRLTDWYRNPAAAKPTDTPSDAVRALREAEDRICELRDMLRSSDRRVITIDKIQQTVATHFKIRLAEMISGRRARSVARPRQVAMYLSKQLTSRSLPEIGRKFGGRDHTTVMHACRKVEELSEQDTGFREDVELLRRTLDLDATAGHPPPAPVSPSPRRRPMTSDPTGGPACSRCGRRAVRKQGHQWLCAKHYRFGQMRVNAKRRGKVVPTHEQLEAMAPKDMACGDCGCVMNWLAADGQTTTATLQHYRDRSMAIVCRSCNTRHAFAPGDSYRHAPLDFKYCSGCGEFRPEREFDADRSRSGPRKIKSRCRGCSRQAHAKWRAKNRERYNAKQRERRANACVPR